MNRVFKIFSDIIKSRRFWVKLFSVLVGDLILAFSIVFLLRPNQMISGGISGLSILIAEIAPLPLSVWVLVLNIPTTILSFLFLKKDFTFFSSISVILLSFYIFLLERLNIPPLTDDVILASIFGGVIGGIGGGLTFRHGTSTGGLDIIAAIFKKYFNMSVGTALMGINLVIIFFSAFIFSADRAMYTLIALYISYFVIDEIQMGVGRQKQVFIISKDYSEITTRIQTDVNRGVTFLKGRSTYSRKDVNIIYLICSPRDLVKVRNITENIDPNAFIAVSDTSEILGSGFKKIEL